MEATEAAITEAIGEEHWSVREMVDWLFALSSKGGKGSVSNVDARALGRAARMLLRLTRERDGEREAREKSDAALRQKDIAMSVLFKRMDAARVDYSDLIP